MLAALGAFAGCGDDAASGPSPSRDGGGGAGGSSIEDGGDGAVDEGQGGSGGRAGSSGSGGGSGGGGSGGAGGGGAGHDGSADGGELDGSSEPEGDAGIRHASCFEGAAARTSEASGACDAPIVIDMRALSFGDSVFHRTGTAATNGLLPSIGKCAEGTGRDVVYNVRVPDATDLEVSVAASAASDPIILVQDGPDTACDKAAATLCVDDNPLGECEYVRVNVAAGGYDGNTPQVVIAEIEPSETELTVSFRLIDPGGGS